jgi:diacylglycerol kinase family enzyme
MPNGPEIDPASPLVFIVNAASGSEGADAKRQAIETALHAAGRRGELVFAPAAGLANAARDAASRAKAARSAVVAVGGDGTINAVAQAAHAEGCPVGVVPQGTFNYFARTHGLPAEPGAAVQALLNATPQPVQVGSVNGKVFLVNASLGLYPVLLEDREAWKARFGRSRIVALGSGLATLLRAHRQLRLRIDQGGAVREVKTPTLFIGNNRLQLEQVGLAQAGRVEAGSIAAVMLKPIGALAMLWLMLRGAFGSLGEADDVESFAFRRMLVTPSSRRRGGRIKVAFDGETAWMRAPLQFEVAAQPLWLLKPAAANAEGAAR